MCSKSLLVLQLVLLITTFSHAVPDNLKENVDITGMEATGQHPYVISSPVQPASSLLNELKETLGCGRMTLKPILVGHI